MSRPPNARVIAGAVLGGVLLGALDLLAQRVLPYPWANLANSAAVWAVGAFAIGAWVRTGPVRPAVAGALLLVVAVESYYLAAALVQHDNLSNMWAVPTLRWLAFGVLAGVVFGTAGRLARAGNRWLGALGVALPGAVLLAEAAVLARRAGTGDAAYRVDSLSTAAIQLALAVAVVLLAGRDRWRRLVGLGLSVPLALLGLAGFLLAGFGG